MGKTNDLGKDPVGKQVLRLAVPTIEDLTATVITSITFLMVIGKHLRQPALPFLFLLDLYVRFQIR